MIKTILMAIAAVALFELLLYTTGCATHCIRCEVELDQCRIDLLTSIQNDLAEELECLP